MADRPEMSPNDARWREAGDRIQTLLDSCAASGTAAYDRAQQLVREVVGLYGAGLERIMQMAGDPGPDRGLVERLATDDLVASLLLVHGLHPHDLHRRVSDALDRVRPYLGSHGGDVDLLDIVPGAHPEELTVRLAFTGSCKSCPSSAVTLELAVQDAVRAAAPEISAIEVVTAAPTATSPNVIPTESLLAHLHSNGHGPTAWHPAPELAELTPGEVAGFVIEGVAVLACRVADQTFAYRDHCPVCDDSLTGSQLRGHLLGCARCGTDFDVVAAGTAAGGAAVHLDPIPLLTRDGLLSVALRSDVLGAPA
ncbi:NifU family protein [Mycobacterium sp. M23085]|uniref:NifU family protein n=1 Tax=Mycobacterium sp. M23085 TaxID=3378087 RepID=UPI00387802F6